MASDHQIHRRSFDSITSVHSDTDNDSSAGSDSTRTSIADNEEVQALFNKLEKTLDGTPNNRISIINSLKSLFYIETLDFQSTAQGTSWCVTAHVVLHNLYQTSTSAVSTSKKLAKHQAADKLYDLIKASCLQTPPPNETAKHRCKLASRQSLTPNQTAILKSAAQELSKLKSFVHDLLSIQTDRKVYLSVDVEAYEQDKTKLLEIGLAWVFENDIYKYASTAGGLDGQVIHSRHFVVEDCISLRNGLWVDDHKDDYNFGHSERVREDDIQTCVGSLVQQLCDQASAAVLVGHSLAGDVEWLQKQGISFHAGNFTTFDVAVTYQAITQDHQRVNLSALAATYGIHGTNFHNGGNDAYYTLEVCLKMMINESKATFIKASASSSI